VIKQLIEDVTHTALKRTIQHYPQTGKQPSSQQAKTSGLGIIPTDA